jgi:hypothetical protein
MCAGTDAKNRQKMVDSITECICELIKELVLFIFWSWLLYLIGYTLVWTITFGRYPRKSSLAAQKELLSAVGLLSLLVLWGIVAVFNNFIAIS